MSGKNAGLHRLQDWYRSQCDGDWEHSYGVHIQTLDNPGWLVEIDLARTGLDTASFRPIQTDRSPTDWVHCGTREKYPDTRTDRQSDCPHFCGAGGVGNLDEILTIFLDWAEAGASRRT